MNKLAKSATLLSYLLAAFTAGLIYAMQLVPWSHGDEPTVIMLILLCIIASGTGVFLGGYAVRILKSRRVRPALVFNGMILLFLGCYLVVMTYPG